MKCEAREGWRGRRANCTTTEATGARNKAVRQNKLVYVYEYVT